MYIPIKKLDRHAIGKEHIRFLFIDYQEFFKIVLLTIFKYVRVFSIIKSTYFCSNVMHNIETMYFCKN